MVRHFRKKDLFDRYQNEIIQCYIRFGVMFVALVVLPAFDALENWKVNPQAYRFLAVYSVWITGYYLLVRAFPDLCPRSRGYLLMATDIAATAWMMYLAGEPSSMFAALFLLYISGYGMRFGMSYAIAATAVTTVCWVTLGVLSPYWNTKIHAMIGWQVAFLIIPFYYFSLVNRLHISTKKLKIALLKTEKIANFDGLTRLANRQYFNEQARELLEKSDRMAVLLIDLDGFKNVNDRFGHEIGDRVLIKIAESLKSCCDRNCVAARLGGDEFIIAVADKRYAEVALLADNILNQVARIGREHSRITASIGVSMMPEDSRDLSELKGFADAAMYVAKSREKTPAVSTPRLSGPWNCNPILPECTIISCCFLKNKKILKKVCLNIDTL